MGEDVSRDHDRCARDVVGFASVTVLRIFRIMPATVVLRRAVPIDAAPTFLHLPVWPNEFASYQSGVRPKMKRLAQGVQPPFLDDGVIVEEHEIVTTRIGGTQITACDEARILLGANVPD